MRASRRASATTARNRPRRPASRSTHAWTQERIRLAGLESALDLANEQQPSGYQHDGGGEAMDAPGD